MALDEILRRDLERTKARLDALIRAVEDLQDRGVWKTDYETGVVSFVTTVKDCAALGKVVEIAKSGKGGE